MRPMKSPIVRTAFASLFIGYMASFAVSAAPLAPAVPATPAAPMTRAIQDGQTPATNERVVIVTSGAAAVRTLADKQAPAVLRPAMGTVLRIVGAKKAAFVPVQAPGGFPVWIHGSLVKTTTEASVLEITANAVNQRPLPSSEQVSFPLAVRLHAGDKVRVIARNDASKPLAEDWVQVWSSAESFGWILEDEVGEVQAGGDKMWNDALAALGARTVTAEEAKQGTEGAKPGEVRADGTDANGSRPVVTPITSERIAQARAALDKADSELVALRTQEAPDLSGVRAAYAQVAEAKVSTDLTARAQAGLAVVDAIESAKALESDLEAEKARRLESLMQKQRQMWEESRRRDPLGGRFDARGVLEVQARAGEEPRYVLRWGPDLVCEVRCSSGRYDLDLFASYELGLKGVLDYTDQTALLKERPVLDLARIEVLSRRR